MSRTDDIPTLLQAATAKYVDQFSILNVLKPRDLAAKILRQRGIDLDVNAPAVEMLLDLLEPQVEEWLLCRQHAMRPKRGRKPADLGSDAIYAVAFFKFLRAGHRPTAARHEAVKWLGKPATKDRVEDGEKRFRQKMAVVCALCGHGFDEALDCTGRLIMDLQTEIEQLAADLDAMKHADELRRYLQRHASISAPLTAR